MRDILNKMLELHGELVEALDAGDVERLGRLADARGALLTDLAAALEAAAPAERASVTADLQRLLGLDRELQSRCRTMRDEVGRRLMSSGAGAGRARDEVSSGVFDRRA